MQTIDKIYKAQIEIKKSNFLSFLCPMSEFKSTHEWLKNEHQKAVHIVWAYRELNKYNQIVENQNDDGEPKGTSGAPSLNALRGANLINTGVFIVRYFGGIKLGTGGLVRAYGTAVNLAIDEARLIKFEQKSETKFFTPFSLIARFEHYFKDGIEYEREFDTNGATWNVNLKQDEFYKFYEFAHAYDMQGFKFLALPLIAKSIF
ncbi:YigZ family protein [Campylobacter sp. faydin G-24]|uniref:YigZ family protein n=1 Tax=Campylobacter anatolicus TaxID=2829105 RepID=A0ABS5HFE3_9BACT|nr:YigZ family protein [Campylobacter anatolicus]MBR8462986.1 YigZ family protein [Campylobacter anatolicus]